MSMQERLSRLPGVLRSPWTFQVAATAGFIGLIVWRVDLTEVAEPLRKANYEWLAFGLAMYAGTRVLDTLRWQVYLEKVGKVPFWPLLGAFVIGNFGNNVLPFRGGDVVKIQILANRYGLPRAGVLSTVFVVEAVLDGVTFLLLLLIGLALLDLGFVPAALLWALAGISGVSFALSVVVSSFFPRTLPESRWTRLMPGRMRQVVADGWPKFMDGMETMRNLRLLGKAAVLNAATWLLQVMMFWSFGQAFGLDVGFATYVVVMIAANLVAVVAITFQNIGTYEVALMEILTASGVMRPDAFAYAVATRAIVTLWVVVLGLLALWLMRIRLREVVAISKEAAEQEEKQERQPSPREAKAPG